MTLNRDFKYRRHVRIRLNEGTKAQISIIHVLGDRVQSGASMVDIRNMSPGGLQFATPLRFPVSKDFALQMKVSLGEWEFSIIGHIEWRRKDENQYLYGCSFLVDQKTRLAITKALHAKLRKMNPHHNRIHDLYRRMTETERYEFPRLDAKG